MGWLMLNFVAIFGLSHYGFDFGPVMLFCQFCTFLIDLFCYFCDNSGTSASKAIGFVLFLGL